MQNTADTVHRARFPFVSQVLRHGVHLPGMEPDGAAVRIAIYLLTGLLLVLLQYTLWFGTGGAVSLWRLKREIAIQKVQNAKISERNQALDAKVLDLRQGLASVQDLARSQLGMVRKNETFFQIVQRDSANPSHRDELQRSQAVP